MSNTFDEFNSWKCMLYADKCRDILDGKFPAPVVLHVYPTNICNSHCNFCIMKKEQEIKSSLDELTFRTLLQDANRMGVKSLHVAGGGEPTLFKHLDAVEEFSGFKVLSTNGFLLNPETATLFDRIRVSVNAGTPETHKKITGVDNFATVVDNIRNVRRELPDTRVGLGFVVSFDNWHEILDVCHLANDLKVDFVHIRPAYFPKGENDDKVRSIMEAAFHLCEAAKKSCNVRIFALSDKFDGYWTPRTYEKCLATPLQAVVSATGEFVVCLDVFIRFGDLKKNRFQEIWGGEEHRKALAQIDISKCPRCVLNRPNEIIQKVFIENTILSELL